LKENFHQFKNRQHFTRRRIMSHFRKMLFAAAAVASFIGTSNVASAQSNPFVCNTSFSPLVVRVEGLRELVGDIVITCNGGNPVGASFATSPASALYMPGGANATTPASGVVAQPLVSPNGAGINITSPFTNGVANLITPTVPAVNISVTVPGIRITNRFVGGSGSNLTDALLFIDEPTTATTGANRISQNPCTGSGGVCTGLNYFFENGLATGAGTTAGGTPLNVFQAQYGVGGGVVTNESTVTFVGVPIVQGGQRTYRIKNIRVQVAGNFSANSQISAILSIQNPPANLVLNNANGLIGFVQQGLVFSTLSGPSYAQCLGFNVSSSNAFLTETGTGSSAATLIASGALRYTEAYGVAFKRRGIGGPLDTFDNQFNQYVNPGSAYAGQSNPTVNYNTESGFYNLNWANLANGLGDAGIASNGTRLRARFLNVPASVRLYVSLQPLTSVGGCSGSSQRLQTSTGNASGICIGQGNASSVLGAAIGVQNVDSVSGANTTSTTNTSSNITVAAVTTLTPNTSAGGGVSVQGVNGIFGPVTTWTTGAYPAANVNPQFSRVNIAADGTGTYFWEVLRADDNTTDRFDFVVAAAFQSTTSIVTDATASVPVTAEGNFAPISTAGGNAYPSIPSFVQAPSSPQGLFSITNCATNLLYPFVTSVSGFNTGIAVANTSKDPWSTINETGICRVFFYGTTPNGGGDPQAQPFTKSVPSGQVAAFELLRGNPEWGITPVPGFQGYVIISCNFRWAHGFAFISDPSNLLTAHGYLALVLDPPESNPTGRNFRATGSNRSESLDN
jgi:hypothetical protein